MTQITLSEVRERYPQYKDMSDSDLAGALHSKFYADMPRDQFNERIGYQPEPARHPLSKVKPWVTGENRREHGVGEASFTPMGDMGAEARIGVGHFLTIDPEARVDMIRNNLPGVQERQDEFGNTIFIAPNGNEFYSNRPGLSPQDATDFVQEGLKYAGAAMFGGAAPAGFRTLATGAATAGQSVGGDLAAQNVGSDQDPDLGRAAIGGIANAGAQKVSGLIGGVLGRRRTAERLAAQGREELGALGAAVDETGAIDDIVAPVATSGTEAAARQEAARSLGINLTRGQSTRNPTHMAQESTIARGGGGSSQGSHELQTFGRHQVESIRDAGHQLARPSQPIPGYTPAQSLDESGRVIVGGLRNVDDTMRQATRSAYEIAETAQAAFGGDDIAALGGRMRQRILTDEFADIASPASQQVHGSTHAFVSRIDELGQYAQQQGRLPVGELEKARQYGGQLMRAARGTPDEPTLRAAMRELDNAMESYAVHGSVNAPALFANARRTARDHLQLFRSRGRNDPAGRAIEKVLNQELDATRALDELFGATGAKQSAPQVARRMREILEPNDPEAFATLRLAYVQRIMSRLPSNGQPFNYGRLVNEWERALTGRNREVTEALFSPGEIGEMKQFLGVLRLASFPNGAYSPSGPAVDQAVRHGLRRMSAAVGFMGGGPLGAGGAYLGTAGVQSAMGRAAAGRAMMGVPNPPPPANLSAALAAAMAAGPTPPDDTPALRR